MGMAEMHEGPDLRVSHGDAKHPMRDFPSVARWLLAQSRHHPPTGVVGPSWLNLPLLKQRQLFPEKKVLCGQSAAGMRHEESQSDEVQHDERQCSKAVCNGAAERA